MQRYVMAKNLPNSLRKPQSEYKKNYIGKKSLPLSVEVPNMISMRTFRIGLIAFMLISTAMVIFIPEPAEAGLLTIVQTSVNADLEAVDVSPGALGRITFSGTVTATNYNTATPLIVSLFATPTIGIATLDKPQVVFQGNKQDDNFKVSVLVPIITTVRQPAQLTITGIWQQGGTQGTVGSSQSDFLVEQFQMMTVFSELPVQEVGPGSQVVFSLRLENTGNFKDEYRIDISNREKLEEKGFIIPQLPKTWVELGTPKIFTLPIQLPHDWTIWTDHPETVWITVSSTSSDDLVKEMYPLIIRVRGLYISGFESAFALMGIAFIAVVLKKKHKAG
jgi:hypothetical protein